MKKLIIAIAAVAFISMSFKDLCDTLSFLKEGSSTTMTHYTDDGKVTGSTKTTYNKISKTGSEVTIDASGESFDKKGKSESKTNYTMKCANGTLIMDMKMMIPAEQLSGVKEGDMKVESTGLEFPHEPGAGQSLKDASITMSSATQGITLFNMNMRMFNRKVESKESVTTPAGTFECFKITCDMESKFLVKTSGKSISWFSPQAGTVKSENYNSKGKLTGYSLLTELKK